MTPTPKAIALVNDLEFASMAHLENQVRGSTRDQEGYDARLQSARQALLSYMASLEKPCPKRSPPQ